MNAEKRQVILSAARHEYSDYSAIHLRSEYNRKKMLGDFTVCGYVLTEGEMLAVFGVLEDERR